MKKVLFAMAIAGMFGFAACNNNKTAEEPAQDTTEIQAAAQTDECCADTTSMENVAEENTEAATEEAAQ